MNLIILKALLNNNNYINYNKYINIRKDNKELSFLYDVLKELQEKHHKDITVDEYIAVASSKAPASLQDNITVLLEQLPHIDISDAVITDAFEAERQKHIAYEIALLGIDVNEGRKGFNSLVDAFSELQATPTPTNELKFVTKSLKELYEHNVKQTGLRWRLRTLNEMLGSLRPGDFGFIFARPESGKTTFLASEVTYFAEQAHEKQLGPIIWFNC